MENELVDVVSELIDLGPMRLEDLRAAADPELEAALARLCEESDRPRGSVGGFE